MDKTKIKKIKEKIRKLETLKDHSEFDEETIQRSIDNLTKVLTNEIIQD
jgi:hypothetical protein